MARPQAFDTSEVLHAALGVFWLKGYEGTSLPDLLEATGLSKSSLYATFGSKRDLFIRAFDAYRDNRVREMTAILTSGTGREAITTFFGKVVNDAASKQFRNGCMSTNQAVELAPADKEIQDRVCGDFGLIEGAIRHAIERGQDDGSITSKASAEVLARQLTAAFPGLQVMVRAGVENNKLQALFGAVLSCLD